MNRLRFFFAASLAASIAVTAIIARPSSAQAQTPDTDGMRFGMVFGGVSTVGVTLEFFDGNRSLDVTVGTWSFRDVSIAAVAKRYMGGSAVRPFVAAGLWVVAAKPAGERLGTAIVLQAPVGIDARIGDDHHLGATINLNRALWVRRTDPEDDYPMNKRLVPLPGVYYRFERR
jgi:hypothetical protein